MSLLALLPLLSKVIRELLNLVSLLIELFFQSIGFLLQHDL